MQTCKKTITDNKQESSGEAVEVKIAEEAKMSEPAHVETEKATEPADAAKSRKKAGKGKKVRNYAEFIQSFYAETNRLLRRFSNRNVLIISA